MIDVNHLTGHVLAHFIKAEGEDNVSRNFLSSACWFPVETHRLSW